MDEDIERLAESNGGYWGSHSMHPVSDWQQAVANGTTRNGYWEWLEAKLVEENDGKELAV